MLVHSSVSASSCTGSYSAEMSLAAVQSTVNSSRWLSKPVHIRCAQCFDTSLVFNLEVRFKCKTDLENSQMIGTSDPDTYPDAFLVKNLKRQLHNINPNAAMKTTQLCLFPFLHEKRLNRQRIAYKSSIAYKWLISQGSGPRRLISPFWQTGPPPPKSCYLGAMCGDAPEESKSVPLPTQKWPQTNQPKPFRQLCVSAEDFIHLVVAL